MIDRQPVLTGDLVHLRPLRPDDWDALYAVASDAELWALHPAHDRWREDVFRRFFDEALASGGALVILDRATGAVIGSSRYANHRPDLDRVEIGWTLLARSHWGGTVNREVKRLMIGHMLRQVPTVVFRVGEANLRSRRALEKIGAVLTDETDAADVGGRRVVHVVYAIDRVPL
jgi:RimJ/RimL family protein N-acetyltransferase